MRCGGRLLERAGSGKESVVRAFKLEDHLFFYFSQILARRTWAIKAVFAPRVSGRTTALGQDRSPGHDRSEDRLSVIFGLADPLGP
jgi:hypothetical protein